jgi:signal transduction histidine kinase
MRDLDWSQTDLGPPEHWPENLRIAVRICLTSRFPIVLWWGQDYTMFYNDAYRSFLGRAKHPQWLGRSGRACWQEIWEVIGPMLEGVFATGQATWSQDLLLTLDRHLPHEEGYFTFSYSPILDDQGSVEGIFCACFETTERVIGERRLRTLRELGARTADSRTVEIACERAAAVLADNPHDIPFAAVYLLDPQGAHARLAASVSLTAHADAVPTAVALGAPAASPWPLASVARTRRVEEVGGLARLGAFSGGPWPEPTTTALVVPLLAPAQEIPSGLLIVGVSPRRVLDSAYRDFFTLVAAQIATAIAEAQAYEEARKRAEALAELDRAKTAFFSNVSHEFRTPLTLMLGPVEDLLTTPEGQIVPEHRELLTVVHRNGLRLQKLVNTLLDFSRLEAGRVEASYKPTDLATMTTELASVFRSAIARAGLGLAVECPPLPEAVYVDRDMWEKIVLNLLSNAFKFTFAGEIAVSLCWGGDHVALRGRDTGTGIPAHEVPHLFERFHRIPNARPHIRRHGHRPGARPGTGAAARRGDHGGKRGQRWHDLHGDHPHRHGAPARRPRGRRPPSRLDSPGGGRLC